jgi:hypothetical protein
MPSPSRLPVKKTGYSRFSSGISTGEIKFSPWSCQVTGGVIAIGEIPPPMEICPSVGSGHHRTKRKKARCRKRAEDE